MALGVNFEEQTSGAGGTVFTSITTSVDDYIASVLGQSSAANRTYTLADDKNGAYTQVQSTGADDRPSAGGYVKVTSAGATLVDWSVNSGTTTMYISLWRLTGVVSVDVEPIGYANTNSVTTCPAFEASKTLSDDSIVIVGLSNHASAGTHTLPAEGSGTERLDTTQIYHYDVVHATGLSTTCDSTCGTARRYTCVAMAFTGDAGGGATIPIFEKHYRSMRG